MSSRRALRWRQCRRKDRYPDEPTAHRYASGTTVPYICRWCGGWHNGHPRGFRSSTFPGRARVLRDRGGGE